MTYRRSHGRCLARAHQDATWHRTKASTALRSLLRECYPSFLDAFAGGSTTNLASADARAVLAANAAAITATRLPRRRRRRFRQARVHRRRPLPRSRCRSTSIKPWQASTYDGHYPNQNSIDLMRVGAATSEGLPVVASAGGNYGEYVYLDHGNGWETRYLHIETNLVQGAVVVQGQHLGVIGKYFAMTPHLHHTQLLNGTAVRVAFNGTLINVHKNAPKDANGNYPTQNLTSKNAPSSCAIGGLFNSGSVTCGYGAAARIAIECELLNGDSKVVRGSFVSAKQTSSANCGGPLDVIDRWVETT